MNGVASQQKSDGLEKKMILFKDGMRIELSNETTIKDYAYYTISFLLMIVFYSAIPLGLL